MVSFSLFSHLSCTPSQLLELGAEYCVFCVVLELLMMMYSGVHVYIRKRGVELDE